MDISHTSRVNTMLELLHQKIGSAVTVHVCGGGASGKGFAGTLIRVEDDHIRMVQYREIVYQRDFLQGYRVKCMRNVYGRKPFSPGFAGFRSDIAIPIPKITAIISDSARICTAQAGSAGQGNVFRPETSGHLLPLCDVLLLAMIILAIRR
jgi:hypothetical protein